MPDPSVVHLCAALADAAALARDRAPGELSDLLREFKSLVIESVESEQGFVVDTITDQVSAYWGGLPSQPPAQAALRACRAARRLVKALAAAPRLSPLGTRIGVAQTPEAVAALCASARSSILVAEGVRRLCAEALVFQEEAGVSACGEKVYRLK